MKITWNFKQTEDSSSSIMVNRNVIGIGQAEGCIATKTHVRAK